MLIDIIKMIICILFAPVKRRKLGNYLLQNLVVIHNNLKRIFTANKLCQLIPDPFNCNVAEQGFVFNNALSGFFFYFKVKYR